MLCVYSISHTKIPESFRVQVLGLTQSRLDFNQSHAGMNPCSQSSCFEVENPSLKLDTFAFETAFEFSLRKNPRITDSASRSAVRRMQNFFDILYQLSLEWSELLSRILLMVVGIFPRVSFDFSGEFLIVLYGVLPRVQC